LTASSVCPSATLLGLSFISTQWHLLRAVFFGLVWTSFCCVFFITKRGDLLFYPTALQLIFYNGHILQGILIQQGPQERKYFPKNNFPVEGRVGKLLHTHCKFIHCTRKRMKLTPYYG